MQFIGKFVLSTYLETKYKNKTSIAKNQWERCELSKMHDKLYYNIFLVAVSKIDQLFVYESTITMGTG